MAARQAFPPPPWRHEYRLEQLTIRTFGEHHVALLLNRPQVHNALDGPLIQALTSTLKELSPSVRTVLLEGLGPSFCAGADLRGWRPGEVGDTEVRAPALSELFATLQAAPQAIVAKVHGAAFGGGAGLVAAVDIAIASEDARFGFTETRLGLVPAVIAPYVVRAIGPGRAQYLFMTAESLSAAQAQAAGLVQQVVPAAALEETCWRVLGGVWRGGPKAIASCKRLLQQMARLPGEAHEALCQKTLTEVRSSDEAQEGIRAFFARQKPSWALKA